MKPRTWIRTAPLETVHRVDRTQPRWFHERLPGYSPTELVPLPDVAAAVGVRSLHMKYERERFGLPAFKMIGALWAVYRLLEKHAGRDLSCDWADLAELRALAAGFAGVTLATATDGNHGRAVARVAGMLGLAASVYVPLGTSSARVDAIRAENADVTVVEGDYDEAVRVAAASAAPDVWVVSDTSWPGYEQVPAWISEGYATLFLEVDEQLAALGAKPPTAVLVPVGVGSLAAAAAQHYGSDARPPTRLIAVEPLGADCLRQSLAADHIETTPGPHCSAMAGLNCGTPSLVAWPILRATITGCVVIDDEPVLRAMILLARAGLVAGETGAASLGALLALSADGDVAVMSALGLGSDADVLVLCTEAATDPESYLRIVGELPGVVGSRRRPSRPGKGGQQALRSVTLNQNRGGSV